MANVKGRKSDTVNGNQGHDGREGHWLETAMGIRHNSDNAPDLFGYEQKNDTHSKTTFGDWSADYYIFKSKNNKSSKFERDKGFLVTFGCPNPKRNNRYSWSGTPVPQIDKVNEFGQFLEIDKHYNICALYNYQRDMRPNKSSIIPIEMKLDNLILAKWNYLNLKSKVEDKFNKKGWYKCLKNSSGYYNNIVFGENITIQIWLDYVRSGDIFFDSGMYQGNTRNYSQWRANNKFWESLIVDKY
jgi:hypothetical protein